MSPVPAAPNRSRLTGVVVSASELEQGGRRRLLLQLDRVEALHGGTFAAAGDLVMVLAFGSVADGAREGGTISGEAEFVGGPGHQVFRMPPAAGRGAPVPPAQPG